MKTWYDTKARTCEFEVGEEVLVVLPTSTKCLEAWWQGPYPITRKVGDIDYEVDVGKSRKQLRVYHVNMLNKWRVRAETCMIVHTEDSEEIIECVLKEAEDWRSVEISQELSEEQRKRIKELV